MATQIQLRRDITTAWNTEDPVLADGELAFDKTNKILKMGDGTSKWSELPVMLTQSKFPLDPCRSVSIVFGGNTNYICWTDPDDLVFNGATVAKWKRTSLVRKAGSYPTSETDGEIIAQTSGNSKNAYRTTAFIDTTAVQGSDYHYKLFSVSDADLENNLQANECPVTDTLTPEMIHGFSQDGTLLNHLSVGDLIVIHHPEFDPSDGYDGQLIRFMGYDCVTIDDNSNYTHAAVFQFEDCLFSETLNYSTMVFDPAETQYALTADAVAITGKTYYTLSGSTYTALVENTDWTAGQAVPDGEWYEKNPNPNYGNGTNKWDESNLRQYLNADAPANTWWVKKNLWDVGSYKARNGFLYNLPFKDLLVPVKKMVARSSTYGGGYITCVDKVFVPSMYEVFGTAINSIYEGKRRWDYYANNDTAAKRIKLLNNEPKIWWLSSPNASNGSSVYTVTTAGASNNYIANNSYGVAPAFAL